MVVGLVRRGCAALAVRERAFGNVEGVLDNAAAGWTRDALVRTLNNTVDKAVGDGKTAVWLKFDPEACCHISPALSAGFELHHAEHQEVYMVKWLGGGPSKVPPHGSHQIGVAGICINERRQVLVCKEKGSKFSHYKFPGGLADRGEELGEAAEREVFEETGVRVAFEGVAGMRHSHKMSWGLSDLYIACRCRPLSEEISVQESEIECATWMDVDAFLAQAKHPMLKVFLKASLDPDLGLAYSQMSYPKFMASLKRPPFLVYHPRQIQVADTPTGS